jgi:peptide/nickel transport system ATP-binding protein
MSVQDINPVVLQLRDVSRVFRMSRGPFRRETLTAVDHVSLQVRQGDVLGIVGESGSGKTTLSKMMLGLLPPTSGEVLLDGRPVSEVNRRLLARRVQFVFQDPFSSLNPRERRACELLDVVGLPARVFDNSPGQLSGGQRQRVVIARALALKPKILVCDEPTSALDVSVQAQILNLLLDLRTEFDLTYVVVSHNLSVVEHIATHVAVMYLGRIVELAETRDIFQAPAHPYTKILLQSAMTIAPGAGIPDIHFDRNDPAFRRPVSSPTSLL